MGYATVKGRKFTVMMKKERVGGYSVWVLELPGCISQGESKEEALANIREAIEGYLEARQIMMKKEAKGAEPIEITL